ncbi:MAG: thioredoxin family protein [bacterium]
MCKYLAIGLALALFCGCQRNGTQRLADLGATSGHVVPLTDATFDQAIKEGVTLVDFWATWCTPCKKQSPVVDEVAVAISNRAVIARFDVDTSKKRVKQFKLEYVPTLMLFKDGKPIQTFTGFTEKEKLIAVIDAAVGKGQ